MNQHRVVFLALFAVPALFAQQPELELRHYAVDHFSIAVPKGWSEMSRADLDEVARQLQVIVPGSDQQYAYGFRLEPGPGNPRILIQVKEGRWSERFFEETSKLPRAKGLLKHGVEETSPALAAMRPEIGEMRWDPDNLVLWLRTQANSPHEGQKGAPAMVPTQAIAGVHLTNTGTIQIHANAPAEYWDKYADVFTQVIASVKIDPEWKYQPRSGFRIFLEEATWLPYAAVSILAALGVGLIARKYGTSKKAA